MNQKHSGGWLCSKQDSESIKLLKLYEEFNKTIDPKLRKSVVSYIKNNRTKFGKILYKTKDCYVDNMTFKEFINSVALIGGLSMGIEDEEEAIKRFIKLINESIDMIFKKNKHLKSEFSKEDVKKTIKLYSFYHPYIGYAFEQRLRDLIKSDDRYDIYTSEELDLKYAIDMQVHDKKTNMVIGLQLKTFSFWYISKDKKEDYKSKNLKGIAYKFCSDVYYVFHDNECNIISNNFESMIHYKKACESEEKYFYVEDENMFLFDLNKAFEEVGNVENDV